MAGGRWSVVVGGRAERPRPLVGRRETKILKLIRWLKMLEMYFMYFSDDV